MKNKNLIIIGAVIIAALFFLKKKKTTTTNGNLILPTDGGNGVLTHGDGDTVLPVDGGNLHPIDMLADNFNYNNNNYAGGLTEGMRVKADNDNIQLILKDGKKFELTNEQWAERGFDSYTTINSNILDQISYGGLYNNGL